MPTDTVTNVDQLEPDATGSFSDPLAQDFSMPPSQSSYTSLPALLTYTSTLTTQAIKDLWDRAPSVVPSPTVPGPQGSRFGVPDQWMMRAFMLAREKEIDLQGVPAVAGRAVDPVTVTTPNAPMEYGLRVNLGVIPGVSNKAPFGTSLPGSGEMPSVTRSA